jgi:hypothetical protein
MQNMTRGNNRPYANEIILDVITKMWFKKNSALTRMLVAEFMGELTIPTVAFALTAVSSLPS